MPFHSYRLPNGLQIIGETSPAARSVAVGFFVKTGARDETAVEAGVSHFLEHMMFKGTARRTAEQVNLDFDRIGASNNASTSEENTVYYAAVLPEYLPQVVDVLADMLRPSLRQDDFDTEKKVILEEIKLYDDQPDSVMADHARRLYYKSHPLGNSVLGTLESVGALTRDQMYAYFSRRYAANNIVVSAAGNFDWQQFVDLVTKACSEWNTDVVGRDNRTEWAGEPGFHLLTRETVQQQYALFVGGGPPADSNMRYAADVLALAVGDYTGSRLYWELVDPGHAESADFGYAENDGSGAIFVSLTCEPEGTAENLERVEKILKEVQRNGITDEEFQQAKNKILSRIVRRSERPMGRMMALASMWTYTGEYRDVDTEVARFDAVTQADIRAYLDAYPIDRNMVVSLGPLKELNGVTGTAVPSLG
ncbi:Protease 3 precursor [Gemmata obscuriglobus]|uniref:Insulinase family protein n=1 Tax=Gemmata obscuriglobus TaxID=114 RepID=A0A2Z3HBC8_9BACT|nr:pitrilysin family protein [Gemmata obscuriglobus]AWM38934.1 insulinase family protein [Gemmata obscuriglobus]QEG28062.1 Protease 3 precursor [Gemmata obscuriglobus]VTS05652.1 peptidase m16 : Putative Zn-dependent peptidase OS=Singulisphaera acidiphila (strain ATCC BAA-1392 / DSM 18658 / VKM B-2454 / MOB10) GN=Sinac_0829 PE=3 SV=1: Peptidase_M16: Peptidase_M16_C [Gemmata obscuriglobus UQM 2246]